MRRNSIPWYGYVLFVMVVLFVMLADEIKDMVWALIFVAIIFIFAFALLLGLSVKLWKKSDSEILKDFPSFSGFFNDIPDSTPALSLVHLGLCSAVILIYMLKAENKPWPVYIFCAFVWILLAVRVVRSVFLRRKSKTRTPHGTRLRVSSQQVIAFLLGLVTSAFFVLFGVIGAVHGAWWFTVPPALIFLSLSTRLVVAAVRSFCTENFPPRKARHRDGLPRFSRDRGEKHVNRGRKDPGENHLNQERYRDPWDRSDKTY